MKSSSNYHCTSLPTKQLSQASQVVWPHNFGGTWWDSDLNGELYNVFPQAAAGFRLWILASQTPDITDISWQFINGIAQLQRCTIFFRGLFLCNNESLVSPLKSVGLQASPKLRQWDNKPLRYFSTERTRFSVRTTSQVAGQVPTIHPVPIV